MDEASNAAAASSGTVAAASSAGSAAPAVSSSAASTASGFGSFAGFGSGGTLNGEGWGAWGSSGGGASFNACKDSSSSNSSNSSHSSSNTTGKSGDVSSSTLNANRSWTFGESASSGFGGFSFDTSGWASTSSSAAAANHTAGSRGASSTSAASTSGFNFPAFGSAGGNSDNNGDTKARGLFGSSSSISSSTLFGSASSSNTSSTTLSDGNRTFNFGRSGGGGGGGNLFSGSSWVSSAASSSAGRSTTAGERQIDLSSDSAWSVPRYTFASGARKPWAWIGSHSQGDNNAARQQTEPYSSDTEQDAATRALIEALLSIQGAKPYDVCQSMRERLLQSLLDDRDLCLIRWDAAVPVLGRAQVALSGSLLMVWLRLTFGLRLPERVEKPPQPDAALLIPSALQERLVARIVEGGYDCSVKDESGFCILTYLLNDQHSIGHLPFRVAILRALLQIDTRGSSSKLVSEAAFGIRAPAEAPKEDSSELLLSYVEPILEDWCAGLSDSSIEVSAAIDLLCQHGTRDTAVLPLLLKCELSGAVLPRWMLSLSREQIASLDLAAAQKITDMSATEHLDCMWCMARSVVDKAVAWQHSQRNMILTVQERQSLFAEFREWLQRAVTSLPSLHAGHDYMLTLQSKELRPLMPAAEPRLRAVLPRMSWLQLSEHSSLIQFKHKGLRTEDTSLLMHLNTRYNNADNPLQQACLDRVQALAQEMKEWRQRRPQEQSSEESSASSNGDGKTISESDAADLAALFHSELDPCGLLSSGYNLTLARAPRHLSAESFLAKLLCAMLEQHVPIQSWMQPQITAQELTPSLLSVITALVETAAAFRPLPDDGEELDDRRVFTRIAKPEHPLTALSQDVGREKPDLVSRAMQLACLLHDLGVRRTAEGYNFLWLLMMRGAWGSIRAWLSPAYARYAMPCDWLSERLPPQWRGWSASSREQDSFGFGFLKTETAEEKALEEAERIENKSEIMMGQATDTRFFYMTWGCARSVEMLALAVRWWTAMHRPKIVRTLTAHLIPDLASVVMDFLVPDQATLDANAVRKAASKAKFQARSLRQEGKSSGLASYFAQSEDASALVSAFSAAAAVVPAAAPVQEEPTPPDPTSVAISALGTGLRSLLWRAQTGTIPQEDLITSLSALYSQQAELEEQLAGAPIAAELAAFDIVPPS